MKDEALEDTMNMQKNFQQEKNTLESKLKRLNMLRISRDFSVEENKDFDNLQKELRKELTLLEFKVSDANVDWFSKTKKDFNLLSEMLLIIKDGTIEQKKDLLHAFRSNLTVSAKKLTVTNKKSIEVFKEYLLLARNENKAFEPKNSEADKDKTEVFASVCPTLLRG